MVSFMMLFVKLLLFQNVSWIIDFNESTTFRAVLWFNICVTVFAVPQNWILKVFGHRYLSVLGKYTFSWYIVHIPMYRVIARNVIGKYRLFETYQGPYGVAIYALSIGFTMLFGIAFYEVVDQRTRAWVVRPTMKWFNGQSVKDIGREVTTNSLRHEP